MKRKKDTPKYKIGDMLYRADKNCYLQIVAVSMPVKGKQEGWLYDLIKVKEREPARYYESKIEEMCVKVDNTELVKQLYS